MEQKGLKDRNRHKNRIKRSMQAWLVCLWHTCNIPTSWRYIEPCGDQWAKHLFLVPSVKDFDRFLEVTVLSSCVEVGFYVPKVLALCLSCFHWVQSVLFFIKVMEVNFLNFFSPLFGSKMKQDKKVIFFFFLRGEGVSVGMHKSFMAKSAPSPPPLVKIKCTTERKCWPGRGDTAFCLTMITLAVIWPLPFCNSSKNIFLFPSGVLLIVCWPVDAILSHMKTFWQFKSAWNLPGKGVFGSCWLFF